VSRPILTEPRAAPLVRDLCRALEAEGVRYCHWKSNAFLDRTLRGENDLDLLVDRSDADAFEAVLHRLGFKRATQGRLDVPGVVHFYGYDPEGDLLVHVHAHYDLVVGDDLTKSYRLPLERAFLREAIYDGELKVPPPEVELLVLVVRLVLKHATWDALLARRGGVSPAARHELAFLEERVDDTLVDRVRAEWLPLLDRATFERCRRALGPDAGRWEAVRAANRLVSELRPLARRSRSADVLLKVSRRAAGIARRVLRRPPRRKLLARGGFVVAVVGGDGAGKSTAVGALVGWLSPPFAVTAAHLGRPPASVTTSVVGAATAAASRAARVLGRPRSSSSAVNAVALARDRRRAVRAARRLADRGEVVVCDRYPLRQLSRMDAPRIEPGGGWLRRRLSDLEQRYYREMPGPDLVVVLRVDPEIAVLRKVDEDPAAVRSRWREIWAVDWHAVDAVVVDAGLPPDDVLRELKALVWSRL